MTTRICRSLLWGHAGAPQRLGSFGFGRCEAKILVLMLSRSFAERWIQTIWVPGASTERSTSRNPKLPICTTRITFDQKLSVLGAFFKEAGSMRQCVGLTFKLKSWRRQQQHCRPFPHATLSCRSSSTRGGFHKQWTSIQSLIRYNPTKNATCRPMELGKQASFTNPANASSVEPFGTCRFPFTQQTKTLNPNP